MNYLFLFGFIFINACTVIPKSKIDIVKIISISVYKDNPERGYTTAGAMTHFDDMKKDGISQLMVDDEYKEKLETILNRADKRKHRQTKFGTRNIFSEMSFSSSNTPHRVVISSVGIVYNIFGNVKEERALITDLSKMVTYKITNSDDLKWLSEFADRIIKIE